MQIPRIQLDTTDVHGLHRYRVNTSLKLIIMEEHELTTYISKIFYKSKAMLSFKLHFSRGMRALFVGWTSPSQRT